MLVPFCVAHCIFLLEGMKGESLRPYYVTFMESHTTSDKWEAVAKVLKFIGAADESDLLGITRADYGELIAAGCSE